MYRFSIHEIALFGRFFGRGSTLANKNTVWKILGLVYLWKRDRLKVSTFGPTLTPLFPLMMAKIDKNKDCCGKTSAIELSKFVKMKPLSHPPFPRKIRLLFVIFGIFLLGNRAGVTSQKSRIKVWQILFYPHDSWSTSCKKVLDQIFPSFAATDHKGHFRTWIFKFGRFSWYHFYIV